MKVRWTDRVEGMASTQNVVCDKLGENM